MVSSISGASNVNYAALKQVQQSPQERFAASDTDGNDSLSLEEYKSFAPDFVQDIEGSFTQIDSDGDGGLTDSELKAFAESSGGPKGPPPSGGAGVQNSTSASIIEALLTELSEEDEDIFSAIDADGDDEISDEELQASVEAIEQSFLSTLLNAQEESLAA